MIWWRKRDVDDAVEAPQRAVAEAERQATQAHAELADAIAKLRARLGIPFDEVLTDIGNDLRGGK